MTLATRKRAYLVGTILDLPRDPLHGITTVRALGDDFQLVVSPGGTYVHVHLQPGQIRGNGSTNAKRYSLHWNTAFMCLHVHHTQSRQRWQGVEQQQTTTNNQIPV